MKINFNLDVPPDVARRLEDEADLLAAVATQAITADLVRRGLLGGTGLNPADAGAIPHPAGADAFRSHSPFQELWERTRKQNASALEVDSRQELYAELNLTCLGGGEAAIDYIEFGVFKGDGVRQWCKLNANPYRPVRAVGCRVVPGYAPRLPSDLPPGRNARRPQRRQPLLIDPVLPDLDGYPPAWSLVIFDEFDDELHEFRALTVHCNAYRRTYKIVAHTRWFTQTAVHVW